MLYSFVASAKARRTIYSDLVEDWGVTHYTVYNNMLLATNFRGLMDDYHHLTNFVQLWDVSCERQIVLEGPDAKTLLQLMVPRNINLLKDDKCFYAPVALQSGKMINDPIVIKVADNKYYLSIASSDVAFFAEGLCSGYNLNCHIYEGDVNIMALQGPLADQMMTDLFDDSYAKMPYFGISKLAFDGVEFLIAKSGWSKQGGYEIYCDNTEKARKLWGYLAEQGKAYNIGPGCPHWIERIEGGLLSYGNDMTQDHSPLDSNLKKFLTLDDALPAISMPALLQEDKDGSPYQLVKVACSYPIAPNDRYLPITQHGQVIGRVSSITPSPKFGGSVGFAMCERRRVQLHDDAQIAWYPWDNVTNNRTNTMQDFSISLA